MFSFPSHICKSPTKLSIPMPNATILASTSTGFTSMVVKAYNNIIIIIIISITITWIAWSHNVGIWLMHLRTMFKCLMLVSTSWPAADISAVTAWADFSAARLGVNSPVMSSRSRMCWEYINFNVIFWNLEYFQTCICFSRDGLMLTESCSML